MRFALRLDGLVKVSRSRTDQDLRRPAFAQEARLFAIAWAVAAINAEPCANQRQLVTSFLPTC